MILESFLDEADPFVPLEIKVFVLGFELVRM
jgi:hypothetical protein